MDPRQRSASAQPLCCQLLAGRRAVHRGCFMAALSARISAPAPGGARKDATSMTRWHGRSGTIGSLPPSACVRGVGGRCEPSLVVTLDFETAMDMGRRPKAIDHWSFRVTTQECPLQTSPSFPPSRAQVRPRFLINIHLFRF